MVMRQLTYLMALKSNVAQKIFCTTTKKGYVDGNLIDVEVMMLYSEVFPKIRTVKRNKVLIARKSREKDDELHYIKKALDLLTQASIYNQIRSIL